MKSPTLIFDLGNVVLTNDLPVHTGEQAKEFCDYFKITYDNLFRGWESSWPEFRVGKISEDDFWKKFLTYALTDKIDTEFAKDFWRKHQEPKENMLDLLEKLKKKYRLATLTTISKEWLEYKRKKFNLDNYFEIIVSSGESGFVKPDKRAYDLILKKLNIDPAECIFIDDLEVNLPPAQKLGMRTILFSRQKDLENELRSFNISF